MKMNRKVRVSTGVGLVMALLLIGSIRVQAMTVLWDSSSNITGLTLADQTTGVPIGGLLLLGNFPTLSDAEVIALGANPVALTNNFAIWASSTIGTGTSTDPDGVGSFQATSISPGTGFFSEQAYLIVFNTGNPLTATQVGVFKGPTTGNSNGDPWIFPASDEAVPPVFTVDDFTSATGVLIGSFGIGTFNSPWSGNNGINALALEVIPEPSTWLLVGSGLVGLALLRRRKA